MSKIKKQHVTLDGMMTIETLDTGLHALQFDCCEDFEGEPFKGRFRVQCMRDGNIYMNQYPKRIPTHAMFRDDNASLTLGRNKRYYFVFTMPEELVDQMPEQLVRQATLIAQKMVRQQIEKQKGGKV